MPRQPMNPTFCILPLRQLYLYQQVRERVQGYRAGPGPGPEPMGISAIKGKSASETL
jgi:hypothetical protein